MPRPDLDAIRARQYPLALPVEILDQVLRDFDALLDYVKELEISLNDVIEVTE